jgi:hypothetical protein
MFLYRLRGSIGSTGAPVSTRGELLVGSSMSHNEAKSYVFAGSISYRIRTLFWIAATNFVFPGEFTSVLLRHRLAD